MAFSDEEDFLEDGFPKECEECNDEGIEGGCPTCGSWPEPAPKTVAGIEYYFVSNTEVGSDFHKAYGDLKKNNKARILFEEAFNCFNHPMSDHVAIWLATADREIVQQEGIFT